MPQSTDFLVLYKGQVTLFWLLPITKKKTLKYFPSYPSVYGYNFWSFLPYIQIAMSVTTKAPTTCQTKDYMCYQIERLISYFTILRIILLIVRWTG